MPTDTQGNIEAEETTAPAIPTEDKPAEATEPTLPDGVAERTAAEFAKLKEHNAQLKAENELYKTKTSVLDDLRPNNETVLPQTPSLTQTEVKEIKSSFVDEDGYVDVARIDQALTQADERARKAEAQAQQTESRVQRFEESAQIRAAHSAYPHLDPKSETFDAKFYELVKNELIGQMMKGEQDIIQAAKHVSEFYVPKVDVTEAKEEAVKEYKSKVTKRDQAFEKGEGRGKTEPSDQEELVRKTLKGDNNALYKRLQASGN
jgi:hypothetical protein